MTALDDVIAHRDLDVGAVRLHAVEAGPADGPVVLLLHGFPEFWYAWRHQIPPLAAAGYRVVAPDLRGYGRSEKPREVAAYDSAALVGDIVGLVAALGVERAHVVGHDWGGAVAWATALARPDVVDRLAILNAPHPGVFLPALRSPGQALRSSYMAAFQLPVLPELVLGARRSALLRGALRAAARRPGAFSDQDLERYAEAFAEPGALAGGLGYYRAMGRRLVARREPGGSGGRVVQASTLVIWGADDPVLPVALADPGPRRVPDRRVVVVDGAGHFVQADAPQRVTRLLLEHLGRAADSAR